MTSSPGSTRPRIAYSITPLPPTVTKTWNGSTGKPLRAEASAAIASRSAGMPANGG